MNFRSIKGAFYRLFLRQTDKQPKLYESINKPQIFPQDQDRIVLKNLDDAIEEIVEARREIHVRKEWNPNKRERGMTYEERRKCLTEIIDAFHFLFTAAIYMGFSFEEIEQCLNDKMYENDNREDHDYGDK